MKVAVIGSGGREHALVRALHQSPSVSEIIAIPGSEGIKEEALCLSVPLSAEDKILNEILKKKVDLVVVGPEGPLVQGLCDRLREQDIAVFGPSREAAQLEGSKIFSKKFMEKAGVPTSRYFVVESVEQVEKAGAFFSPPYVLKADGLAGGKGVFICENQQELKSAARYLFEENKLGEAGKKALVEEYLPGWELSFLILTDGKSYSPLPLSQDHKRLKDNDMGPNTGGMGVVGPLSIENDLRREIEEKILQPTIHQLQKDQLLYRGVLYVGIMVTPQGPFVLEYNVRFGDPEAQVILPLLRGDWGLVMKNLAEGHLSSLSWQDRACACLVLAAEGYPDHPISNVVIGGEVKKNSSDHYILHAGTAKNEKGQWVTGGGRVLNVIGIGKDLKEAVGKAYQLAQQINWPGMQMRKDIGKKVMNQWINGKL